MLPEIVTAVPGPKSLALARTLRTYESRNVTYTDPGFPVFWDRGDGVNIWDVDGNRFLDLTSAFGVSTLGHNPAVLRTAAAAQLEKLTHAMGDVHPSEGKARLCEALSHLTFERWGLGVGKSILTSSGSEAVEAALKTSLLFTGKPGIVSFRGAYHGLGHGSLEASGLPFFRDPFRGQLASFAEQVDYPACARCPFGALPTLNPAGPFPPCHSDCLMKIEAQILAALARQPVGAILVEPIQGRAGHRIPPLEFLRMLRRICDAERVLLIFDEIYTGFHRTGKRFACDHSGVAPDILCLGKALTGGFPLSACVGRSDVMDAWPPSDGEALHTSTFLGNPVGCAMALASIEVHEKASIPETIAVQEAMWRSEFERLQGTAGVRGLGLFWAVDTAPTSVFPIVKRALADGLILLGGGPSGDILTLTPPMGMTREEISFAVGRIQEYLTSRPGSIS